MPIIFVTTDHQNICGLFTTDGEIKNHLQIKMKYFVVLALLRH